MGEVGGVGGGQALQRLVGGEGAPSWCLGAREKGERAGQGQAASDSRPPLHAAGAHPGASRGAPWLRMALESASLDPAPRFDSH